MPLFSFLSTGSLSASKRVLSSYLLRRLREGEEQQARKEARTGIRSQREKEGQHSPLLCPAPLLTQAAVEQPDGVHLIRERRLQLKEPSWAGVLLCRRLRDERVVLRLFAASAVCR